MKQQSAVEYIVDELLLELYLDCNISPEKRDRVLQTIYKGREMFKEQIIHAATYGGNAESPEKYYKDRY